MKALWFGVPAFGLALAAFAALAQAACPAGPAGNLCKAENGDPLAMYMIGREAYLAGRETGDLTEAFDWARRSRDAGFRGGRMLLKMVYVQMGEGTHRDYPQAWRWLTAAMEAGDDYLEPWRGRLEKKMSPDELGRARGAPAE